jgi:hypothetical protein
MKIAGVIICIALCAFIGWELFGFVKDIKKRAENRKKKQNETLNINNADVPQSDDKKED